MTSEIEQYVCTRFLYTCILLRKRNVGIRQTGRFTHFKLQFHVWDTTIVMQANDYDYFHLQTTKMTFPINPTNTNLCVTPYIARYVANKPQEAKFTRSCG